MRHKGQMKPVPYWGSKNIKSHHTVTRVVWQRDLCIPGVRMEAVARDSVKWRALLLRKLQFI
jgi:hypothetical protein